MAVSAGYFDDNNLVAAAFYDLYIAVRKDIYIDDGVIIDAVPKSEQFFGGGERHTGKALVCIFYNAKQNITAEVLAKRSMSPRCYGVDRLELFSASMRLFSLYLLNCVRSSIW